MRRFKNKADSALALLPAALKVLALVAGGRGGAEFVHHNWGPERQTMCQHCGCRSYFAHHDKVPGDPEEMLYECAKCRAVFIGLDLRRATIGGAA